MNKEVFNLWIKANESINKEYNYILSLNKTDFLEYLPKQRIINGSNNIAIFAAKDYKPHFTEKDRRMFLYMFNNKVFDKYIFDKKRPKELYKIETSGGDIFAFVSKHKERGGRSSKFFIVK